MKNQVDLRAAAKAAKFIKDNLHKLVRDLPSEIYHGLPGTWSSTQFKDIIDDEEVFIKKYIKKEIARQEKEAFDTGTYFHTGVLEPHKIKSEIAMYSGKVRHGKEWEKFKKANPNKAIITQKQKEEGDNMIKAVKNSPVSMSYLDGDPEVSLFVTLVIWEGSIYAPKFGKVLTSQGWETYKGKIGKGFEIIVKVRADNLGDSYVSDLKSTSGNARSEHSIRGSISKYKYDLSAALYLDMFSLIRPSVHEFIWIFASKSANNAKSWRATNEQILIGRAKYIRAMNKLADCAHSNWELVDCLGEANPMPYEFEWLREKETDLL